MVAGAGGSDAGSESARGPRPVDWTETQVTTLLVKSGFAKGAEAFELNETKKNNRQVCLAATTEGTPVSLAADAQLTTRSEMKTVRDVPGRDCKGNA